MQMSKVTNRLCKLPGRLDGKLAIVTGANIGSGLELTGELARRGCTVIMACRDLERACYGRESLIDRYGERSQEAWRKSPAGAALIVEHLDLACLSSIREFARKIHSTYTRLDLLIHNAGMMATSYMETHDGLELQMGVNHFGPALLIDLLLPLLANASCSLPCAPASPSRIIVVASNLYQQGEIDLDRLNLKGDQYGPFKAYNQSKLAIILYIRELANQLNNLRIIPMTVHPGAVRTEISYTANNTYQVSND
ncbi:unnamed protein product [Trichobilharzia regenti]|nr:unnamed protein product [Trichobilharzia regenti]